MSGTLKDIADAQLTMGRHLLRCCSVPNRVFFAEPPRTDHMASDSNMIRDLEVALAMQPKASRIVPKTKASWPRTFEIGDLVLVRRGRRVPVSRITSASWYGPFIVKESGHPCYILPTEDCRKSRRLVNARRLRRYVQ